MAANLIEQVKALDDEQRAELADVLSPHLQPSVSRRQMLGIGGATGLAALMGGSAPVAASAAMEPAQAADGVMSDLNVLQSGDGTPIGFGNAVEFDHQAVSSATTIGNVTVVEYDSSIAGFTLTIPASLEVHGMVVRFLDTSGSADTNSVDVQNSAGGTIATIDAAHSIYEVWWDGAEWLDAIFTERLDAGTIATGSIDNGGSAVSVGDALTPDANTTHDLGSASASWNDVFVNAIKDDAGNVMLADVAFTGNVTLTSDTGVVDTGLSDANATFLLSLGVDDPNADVKLSGTLFWDDSAGTYKVEITENIGGVNPTVEVDVIRVR